MVIVIQWVVMQEDIHTLTNKEAISYTGGAGGLTASFIASTVQMFRMLYSFGQNLGSSVYRYMHNIRC